MSGRQSTVRVFVSYSHQDTKYLENNSLLGFLSGLKRDNFEFWDDRSIRAGDLWDDVIKAEIEKADIVLALVSQGFLNSRYCTEVEMRRFLERRRSAGLIIFPIIISPCNWESHQWLAATQFEPRGGKSIERHYKDRGSRAELFLRIYQQLEELGHVVKGG